MIVPHPSTVAVTAKQVLASARKAGDEKLGLCEAIFGYPILLQAKPVRGWSAARVCAPSRNSKGPCAASRMQSQIRYLADALQRRIINGAKAPSDGHHCVAILRLGNATTVLQQSQLAAACKKCHNSLKLPQCVLTGRSKATGLERAGQSTRQWTHAANPPATGAPRQALALPGGPQSRQSSRGTVAQGRLTPPGTWWWRRVGKGIHAEVTSATPLDTGARKVHASGHQA